MWSLVLLSLPALALANPVVTAHELCERATPTVPQQTPTGSVCLGATPSSSISPTQLALAVAGCPAIQPAGTNFTRNDIVEGICKPFTLIFARGTTEDANLGNIVGPPFISALNATFGADNVAVQGVNDYPAIGPDYCVGGSLTGSQNLASLVQQTMKQCPKTKLCVSGYSQGCQVVHNAFQILKTDPQVTKFVNSVVLFGDPDQNLPVGKVPKRKISIDCHVGDDICQNGENVLLPHVTYCRDVNAQAAFVKARSLAKN